MLIETTLSALRATCSLTAERWLAFRIEAHYRADRLMGFPFTRARWDRDRRLRALFHEAGI